MIKYTRKDAIATPTKKQMTAMPPASLAGTALLVLLPEEAVGPWVAGVVGPSVVEGVVGPLVIDVDVSTDVVVGVEVPPMFSVVIEGVKVDVIVDSEIVVKSELV